MAFQAPIAYQNVAFSVFNCLPSLSSTSHLSRHSISRKPGSQPAHQKLSTTSGQQQKLAGTQASSESTGPDERIPYNVAHEILGDFPATRLHNTYSPSILRAHDARTMLLNAVATPLRSNPFVPNNARSFSTATRLGPWRLSAVSRNNGLPLSQIRTMTAGHTSQNLLAHMEQTANNNPSSGSAQNAFYSALMRANMPQILVERYETGRYATNPACDALYTRALERLGQTSGPAQQVAPQGQYGPTGEQVAAARAAAIYSRANGSGNAQVRQSSPGNGQKASPLYVVIQDSNKQWILKVIKTILMWGLIGYLVLIGMNLIVDVSGIVKGTRSGATNAEVKPEQQKTRFSDVKGCDEAIEEMKDVVEFLKNPDKFNKLGGKLPKGVLMVGPPGTGKTLLARAVAGEAGVPFFYMAGSEFDEVYVGVGAKRVRELFTNAKNKAPAIVFIDELDAVGGKRNERDAAYHMQTLNQMLTELDGFDSSSGVVFIAATNFPQMLDKALTRPGRFDRQIYVDLPNVRGRLDILKYHARNMQLSTDVDFQVVARGTPGASGADLENIVNQAATAASKKGASKISMIDFEWARDRLQMGPEKKSIIMTDDEKLMTAYHEAGHTLAALYSKAADPLHKVTILPRGMALGVTHFLPDMDKYSSTRANMTARIDVCFGGQVAEEMIYGVDQVTSGCSSDLENATNIAYQMVLSLGMGETLGYIAFSQDGYRALSNTTKMKVEDEIKQILDTGRERTKEILRIHKKELDLLAHALVKYETLTKEEVVKVIKGEELKNRMEAKPPSGFKLPEIQIPANLPQPASFGSTRNHGQ